MRTVTLIALLLAACSREPEATPDTTADAPVVEAPVEPVLVVSSPARMAFAPDGAASLVGSVVAGSSPLTQLTLNGEAVPLGADGAFDTALALEPGINILSLRAEDEGSGRAVDGRAVYAGPLHDPGVSLPAAVRMQLGPELLDDDDADLDDVAAIAELVMLEADLSTAFVGLPIDAGFATITPQSLSFDDVSVDIVPLDGELAAAIVLHDVWMDFEAEDNYIGLNVDGSAWLDSMTLSLSLAAEGSDIAATDAQASLEGYGLEVDWVPGWLEDDLAGWTQETLETEIAATAQDTVAELVGEYIGAFAIEAEILDGVELSVSLAEVASDADGLRLELDASVSVLGTSLPTDAGSAATDGAAPAWPASASPFWVAADDDLVNQIMFAMWGAGALSGFSYSGAELTALSGAEIVPPLGPVSDVSLGIEMPPSLHPPTADDMSIDLRLGEWTMVFTREDGEVLSFSVNARTGAQVSFTDDDEIAFAMDNRPANMAIAVGVTSHPDSLDPGDLAALIKLMVPPLFGNASSFLPSLALPPLDLGLVSPSLEGVALAPADLSLSLTDETWLVLDGRLLPQ